MLEEQGQDAHGRTLATIYVRHANGNARQNVNERMVMLGHAWVMRAYYDHLPKDRQAKLNHLEWLGKVQEGRLVAHGKPHRAVAVEEAGGTRE